MSEDRQQTDGKADRHPNRWLSDKDSVKIRKKKNNN